MAFNFDRTEASDPISVDDRLLALMREQGGNPGMAKLPGAPMIVANPLYPDEAASAPQPPARPASAGKSGGGRAPTPPKRPVEAGGEGENGGFSGGAKYAGLTQPGGTQAPTPPTRPPEQGGSPEGQGPHDYTVPGAIAGAGAAGLLALLLARRMRGQGGEVPANVMPEEAGGPAKPRALPAPQEKLALPAPEEQKLLPKPETIYAGDESGSPKQLPAPAPEPEGELIKPEEFKKPEAPKQAVAEEVPAGEEKAPPKKKRGGSSKKAVGDANAEKVILPNSGIEADKGGINEALSKLLSLSDQVEGLVRGGGTKLRVPKIR